MANSYSSLFVHIIFSTQERRHTLSDTFREPLHSYLAGIAKEQKCDPILINSVDDHLHGLFKLSRDTAVGNLVMHLKRASSLWVVENYIPIFSWQRGYGAFSGSQSIVPRVFNYIQKQKEHHQRIYFEDELRKLYKCHDVQWDEKYLLD